MKELIMLKNRLKELRKEKGFNQEEVGDAIGVTKVSICCYENGNRFPSLESIIKLANYFNVSMDYLLGRDLFIEEREEFISTKDLEIINLIKKHNKLYDTLVNSPERTIQFIKKKVEKRF